MVRNPVSHMPVAMRQQWVIERAEQRGGIPIWVTNPNVDGLSQLGGAALA